MGLALRASLVLAVSLGALLPQALLPQALLPQALWCGTKSAQAATGEWRLGAAVGAGLSTRTDAGLAARISASYEVVQNLELGLSAGFAWNARRAPGVSPRLLSFTPGVSYQFDVIQWIPYVGASGGYYFDVAEGRPRGVVLAPEVGLDYLLSRELRAGIQYRPCFFLGSSTGLPMHQLLARFQIGSGW